MVFPGGKERRTCTFERFTNARFWNRFSNFLSFGFLIPCENAAWGPIFSEKLKMDLRSPLFFFSWFEIRLRRGVLCFYLQLQNCVAGGTPKVLCRSDVATCFSDTMPWTGRRTSSPAATMPKSKIWRTSSIPPPTAPKACPRGSTFNKAPCVDPALAQMTKNFHGVSRW